MEKVSKPRVTPLSEGKNLISKQMAAKAGDLLPKHKASVESALDITQGACTIQIEGKELPLKQGEVLVIPAEEIHQIRAIEDLKAIHVMPREIKFEFYN